MHLASDTRRLGNLASDAALVDRCAIHFQETRELFSVDHFRLALFASWVAHESIVTVQSIANKEFTCIFILIGASRLPSMIPSGIKFDVAISCENQIGSY